MPLIDLNRARDFAVMSHYIGTHWQGRQSLPRSALLNGVVLYVAMVIVLLIAGPAASNNAVSLYAWLVAFLLWMVWALVGIVRCGVRYTLDRTKPILSRIGGCVALVGVVSVAAFTINDLIRLGLL